MISLRGSPPHGGYLLALSGPTYDDMSYRIGCKGHTCGYLWKTFFSMSLMKLAMSFIKDMVNFTALNNSFTILQLAQSKQGSGHSHTHQHVFVHVSLHLEVALIPSHNRYANQRYALEHHPKQTTTNSDRCPL